MFSQFDKLSILPKPFELFKQREGFREGATTATTPSSTPPNTTDDQPQQNTSFAGILTAIFFILFVIIGLIYYFNSTILMVGKLMQGPPYYNKTNFWQKYKPNMVASKLTIFLMLWLIIFCVNLLVMDTVFQNHEYDNIFFTTTIYYWGIVGSTMLVIGNIPSLVEVFENTIGYWILGTPLYNLSHTMSMFKNRNFQSGQFTIPYDFLITTFNVPNTHELFDQMVAAYPTNDSLGKPVSGTSSKSDFYIDLYSWENTTPMSNRPNDPPDIASNLSIKARRELLKQVLTKNTIGHFVWVLLASYVSVLLTINTIYQ